MADIMAPKIPSSSATTRSKRQAKGATAEDPCATAKVRAILDPEQADLVIGKLQEIQSRGATVDIATSVEGSIERIVCVGGNPAVVGEVLKILLCFFLIRQLILGIRGSSSRNSWTLSYQRR